MLLLLTSMCSFFEGVARITKDSRGNTHGVKSKDTVDQKDWEYIDYNGQKLFEKINTEGTRKIKFAE